MSSKNRAKAEPVKTQSMEFKVSFDFEFDTGAGITSKESDVFIVVGGIPEDVPKYMSEKELQDTLQAAVRKRFVEAMKPDAFLEVYRRGHNRQDSEPMYINTSRVVSFGIVSVTKL